MNYTLRACYHHNLASNDQSSVWTFLLASYSQTLAQSHSWTNNQTNTRVLFQSTHITMIRAWKSNRILRNVIMCCNLVGTSNLEQVTTQLRHIIAILPAVLWYIYIYIYLYIYIFFHKCPDLNDDLTKLQFKLHHGCVFAPHMYILWIWFIFHALNSLLVKGAPERRSKARYLLGWL